MRTAHPMEWTSKGAALPRIRFVGVYYLLTALASAFVFFFHGKQVFAADLGAAAFYIAVTALFYGVSRSGSKKKVR